MSLLTELQRRRKDNRYIVALVLAVLVVWAVVAVLERRADEPETVARGILLFVLSYINITLIAAVLFVLGRSLLKTWLERRRRELGSQFKTKLLLTYLGLTAIPIGLLFFVATGLLQRSIDRWFSTPVREVVQRARSVQDMAERRIGDQATGEAAAAARVFAAQVPPPIELEAFRRDHRLDSLEAYREGDRIALSADRPAEVQPLPLESLKRVATGPAIDVLPDGSHRYRAPQSGGALTWVAGLLVVAAGAVSGCADEAEAWDVLMYQIRRERASVTEGRTEQQRAG